MFHGDCSQKCPPFSPLRRDALPKAALYTTAITVNNDGKLLAIHTHSKMDVNLNFECVARCKLANSHSCFKLVAVRLSNSEYDVMSKCPSTGNIMNIIFINIKM